MRNRIRILAFLMVLLLQACTRGPYTDRIITVWLIGDSTVADYTLYDNYESERYPVTGWGQVFQTYMSGTYLDSLKDWFDADSVVVDDRARGGRSTRTFFQEGRWRQVRDALKPGDFVLIQFGHNDAAVAKTERYVDTVGYKEFLRLFIEQTREKKARPVLITPVARNYPWENGHLSNVHGSYPASMKEVAVETATPLIDLNQLSMDSFSEKGQDYVSTHYFMNLPPGVYPAYPDGQNDNTHFQPEGAREVARLVYEGLVNLAAEDLKK
ncbi:MAG: rhamnogalacturonan acetylesterase [Bacteroidota bacterium]